MRRVSVMIVAFTGLMVAAFVSACSSDSGDAPSTTDDNEVPMDNGVQMSESAVMCRPESDTAAVGEPITARVIFAADAPRPRGLIVTVDWGDDQTSDIDVDAAGPEAAALGPTADHAYTAAGTYTIGLRWKSGGNEYSQTCPPVTITDGTDESGDAMASIDPASYNGLSLEEAEGKADEAGLQHRVVSIDGQPQKTTRDLRRDRLNFTVVDDTVTDTTVG